MLNRRSRYLVVLVATYNRLELLKRTLSSIARGTRVDHEVIVIDGGSSDGTIEYLQNRIDVTPVFQGKLLGTARAYNQVWREIESKYTCWLSDDTEVTEGILDLAIAILEDRCEIGMVGLKMKDTIGPFQSEAYLGGFSKFRILNCNHGVLRLDLLRSVGFFNESYRSYTIDPDLTASVLSTGKHVVLTRRVGVLHHREWALQSNPEDKIKLDMNGIDNGRIYYEKFRYLEASRFWQKMRRRAVDQVAKILFHKSDANAVRWGLNRRDWRNIARGRFIGVSDSWLSREKPYYLHQKIPRKFLLSEKNPYRKLALANLT